MRTRFSYPSHTSCTMRWNNNSFFRCYDPELHVGIIHPLQMPYFRENNKFILDYLAKNTRNKTRNHLITGKKALEIPELIFCVEAGLKHEVWQNITRFDRRKAFRGIFLQRNEQRIHANHWDLLNIPFLNTAFQWIGISATSLKSTITLSEDAYFSASLAAILKIHSKMAAPHFRTFLWHHANRRYRYKSHYTSQFRLRTCPAVCLFDKCVDWSKVTRHKTRERKKDEKPKRPKQMVEHVIRKENTKQQKIGKLT